MNAIKSHSQREPWAMPSFKHTLLSFVLSVALLIPGVHGDKGQIYCEIISFPSPERKFRITINQTCPTGPGYFDVTKDMVKKTHPEAQIVVFNGRRAKMMDEFNPWTPGEFERFEYGKNIFPDGSGFQMSLIAYIDDISEGGPYGTTKIQRPFDVIWRKGTRVYLMIEPRCSQIWIMQSLNFADHPEAYLGLEGGEERLLDMFDNQRYIAPPGWKYYSTVLDFDVFYNGVDGIASVMSDIYFNNYSGLIPGTYDELCECPCRFFDVQCRYENRGICF